MTFVLREMTYDKMKMTSFFVDNSVESVEFSGEKEKTEPEGSLHLAISFMHKKIKYYMSQNSYVSQY